MTSPVIVVAPPTRPGPVFGELMTSMAASPHVVPVIARPNASAARRGDLFSDVLDALGRPGVSPVARRFQPHDLTLLVPFLLTDDVDELVVAEAQWLRRQGVEELLAASTLGGLRTWLLLGEEPDAGLAALLSLHVRSRWQFDTARRYLRHLARRRAPDPGCCGTRWRLRQCQSADEERHQLADRLRALRAADSTESAFICHDAHGRDVLRLGVQAAASAAPRHVLRTLTPAQIDADGGHITMHGSRHPVLPMYRRALARQRLHALVVGQRPSRALLTSDGATVTPLGLDAILGPEPRDQTACPGPPTAGANVIGGRPNVMTPGYVSVQPQLSQGRPL